MQFYTDYIESRAQNRTNMRSELIKIEKLIFKLFNLIEMDLP